MPHTALFQVYVHRAYRSEIALFQAEGVTAEEASQYCAPAGTDSFYRVGHDFYYDLSEALAAFRADAADSLCQFNVAS
jgi:carboxypeptidase C (cathepsin A)